MKHKPTFYITKGEKPFVASAKGIYITDENGKQYLDGCSGAVVCQIGHSHPKVLEALHKQLDTVQFTYRTQFENRPAEDLGYKITKHTPKDLDRVFFVSGGSEATETALKLVKQYHFHNNEPGKNIFISRIPSYHGATMGSLGITGFKPLQDPFLGNFQVYPKISSPTQYRIPEGRTAKEHAIACADELEAVILEVGAHRVAGFIAEPIGGATTGAEVPHDAYFPRIVEICKKYNVKLILDEVLCGVGRSGTWLASSYWNTVADVICLAKGLGAGYAPLAAIVAKNEMVEKVLDNGGFMHGFTYAGNPMACAAGCAVLDVIEEENLVENAAVQGDYLIQKIKAMAEQYPWIGDVRGRGLLIGVEFADKETKEAYPDAWDVGQTITNIAYENGLLVYPKKGLSGVKGDHVLVSPPLVITREQCDELLMLLKKTFDEFTPVYQKFQES